MNGRDENDSACNGMSCTFGLIAWGYIKAGKDH
jgi:hypothetical protein